MKKIVSLLALIAVVWVGVAPNQPVRAQKASVELKDCKYPLGIGDKPLIELDAKCGTLDVPENHADPAGRKLTISFAVLPATDPAAKGLPIFHLEGGPGGSALKLWGLSWYSAYASFRKNHPVVLIDQRGIGKSASLQCTEITLKAFDDLTSAQTETEAMSEGLARYRDCLERVSRKYDPQYFTSNALADDTDLIRAALGYDQILVFGNSYGTWLAQYYLKRHGAKAAGVVLDSVVGPWNNFGLDIGTNGQASLDGVIKLCEEDASCNKAYPNLSEKFTQAVDRLRKTPARTAGMSGITGKSYGMTITVDKFRGAIFQSLYGSANYSLIPQMISDASKGIFTFPATILASAAEQADLISTGLYASVICAEMAAFYTDDLARKYISDTLLFGTVEEQLQAVKSQQAVCSNWKAAKLSPEDVAPIRSDRPVLILTGGLDPVTPPKYGEETLQRMSKGTWVNFPYQGHGVIVNSACAQNMTRAFLANPSAKLDTACVEKDIRPIFIGAYTVQSTPFNKPDASFVGAAPKDWTPEQVGTVTFFTSPDQMMYAAGAVYKDMDVQTAKQQFFKAVSERYGGVLPQQELTQNVLFISITIVAHSMEVPNSNPAYQGILYLQPEGKNVKLAWVAGPNTWVQAASLPILPIFLTARAR
jgi:pimeloyl-ACP methyl ester carboxylesterase